MFDGDDFFDIIPDMDFDGDHDIVDFLILDEPVSHLDSANAAIMVQMLENEIHQSGTGLIVTTIGHDLPYGYDKVLML